MNPFRPTMTVLTAGIALTLALTACGSNAAGSQDPPRPGQEVPATAGFVTGRVTDQNGTPIVNAKVIGDNTLLYNTNSFAYSDQNGFYKLDIRKPVGTWNVTAKKLLDYEGETIEIDLETDNPMLLAGTVGGVRNFVYKPSTSMYGNLGVVKFQTGIGFYPDMDKIVVKLKSVGKLADGSSDVEIVSRLTNTPDGFIIKNVMFGTYDVTATYNDTTLFVRKRASSGEEPAWGTSFRGGFWRDFYSVRSMMFLEMSDDECPDILQSCRGE